MAKNMLLAVLFFLCSCNMIITGSPFSKTGNKEVEWSHLIGKRSLAENNAQAIHQEKSLENEAPVDYVSPDTSDPRTSSIDWQLLSNPELDNLAQEMRKRRKRSALNFVPGKQRGPSRLALNRRKRDSNYDVQYIDQDEEDRESEKMKTIPASISTQLSDNDLKKLAYLIGEMQSLNDEEDKAELSEINKISHRPPKNVVEPEVFYRNPNHDQEPYPKINLLDYPDPYYARFLQPRAAHYSDRRRRLSKRSPGRPTTYDDGVIRRPEVYNDYVLVNPIQIAKSIDDAKMSPANGNFVLLVDPADVLTPTLNGANHHRLRQQFFGGVNPTDGGVTDRRRFSSANAATATADHDDDERRPLADVDDDERRRFFAAVNGGVDNGAAWSLSAAPSYYEGDGAGGDAAAGWPRRRLTELELEKRIASLARYLDARKKRMAKRRRR